MMKRPNASLFISVALLVIACSTRDLIVVEQSALDDNADASVQPRDAGIVPACKSNSDCTSIQYCRKKACADVSGVCDSRPAICGDGLAPSCGCDGVSYWNECLRRSLGMSAEKEEECTYTAERCGGHTLRPCSNANYYCAPLSPPQPVCRIDEEGKCWALPANCPDNAGPKMIVCKPGPLTCVSLCTAIQAQTSHMVAAPKQCM